MKRALRVLISLCEQAMEMRMQIDALAKGLD